MRCLLPVVVAHGNGNPIRLLAIGYWHFCPEIKGTAALILNFLRSGKLFDIPSSTISHLRGGSNELAMITKGRSGNIQEYSGLSKNIKDYPGISAP